MMRNRDLIAVLSKLDPDAEVVVVDSSYGNQHIHAVYQGTAAGSPIVVDHYDAPNWDGMDPITVHFQRERI